ncbi:threonine ammonia-lyase [Aurantiacibacter rhizosphaerae]|uniref:Pyridoxal-phosphate dependent enzyme n=1 Tax=Aurantiacibacter rhizosphaerae TaxID=2691582 RepID=A0A844XDE9_9SPHN|nr:pyridoxal-phosphate dependent enzyme [Aurantiacibacter rhizosphaerae]MWV27783.1 pyridoxal-phosphate dependent enzyme [Aurantiacibacter rhizosphaerae]
MTEHTIRQPTRDGVLKAARKVSAILPATPLIPLEIGEAQVWVKAECLQPVGAFKIRGAWHRLSALDEDERARGVVAVSSGNHAQGVAWAARRLGIEATIVMPRDAPPIKLERTKQLGATVVTYDRMTQNREEIAQKLAAEKGAAYVHAFADAWVIEGQGSAGIEVLAQLQQQGAPPPTRILACCGGGGLSAGLALACPEAQIVPVEPKGWDDVCRSLETGAIQSVGACPPTTACDALQTFQTSPINFAVLKERCDHGLRATEEEVKEAQRFAFANLRLVLEPGGAVALAAALAGKAKLDGTTVIILSGGNVDPQQFAKVIANS